MLLTLGAAGVTLLAILAVVGIPAVDVCNGDGRGLAQCLRGMVNDRFDLRIEPQPALQPKTEAEARPIVAAIPAALPEPNIEVAAAPPAVRVLEQTRSLVPQVVAQPNAADFAPAPPPLVATSRVAPVPELVAGTSEPAQVVHLPAPEESEAAPIEATARASAVESTPSVVQAPAAVAVAGEPPDTAVAGVEVADLPPAVIDAAPVFVPPAPPITVDGLPPDLAVSAIDPADPAEAGVPSTLMPAPSIDAVEIDGNGNIIAGTGPAGAVMRLYVDDLPVGVSPVEGGRWLVEGTDLLTEERQAVKVEALDPITGKVLGEATLLFEGPIGAPMEPLAEEAAAPVDEPAIPLPAVAEPTEPADDILLPVEAPTAPGQPEAALEPAQIPPIATVVPSGETASVTILGPSGGAAITTLATGKVSDDAVSTLVTRPMTPAILATFAID